MRYIPSLIFNNATQILSCPLISKLSISFSLHLLFCVVSPASSRHPISHLFFSPHLHLSLHFVTLYDFSPRSAHIWLFLIETHRYTHVHRPQLKLTHKRVWVCLRAYVFFCGVCIRVVFVYISVCVSVRPCILTI